MRRRLGQHFLTDPRILDRIVDAIDPQPDDIVLEIGAGTGTLTRRVAPRVGWVVAVEKDVELVGREQGHGIRDVGYARGDTGRGTEDTSAVAATSHMPANVSVIHGDALKLDWNEVLGGVPYPVSPVPYPAPYKLIGNIPYYITTPLIDKALAPPLPDVIVFLVQKEVAERLVAEPGGKTYGALSVGVQAVAHVERLFTVRRGSFQPAPTVDSAVVQIRPRSRPLLEQVEREPFREFVQQLFGQRRKQIGTIMRGRTHLDRQHITQMLAQLEIDPRARPEVLQPETLIALFHAVRKGSRPPR